MYNIYLFSKDFSQYYNMNVVFKLWNYIEYHWIVTDNESISHAGKVFIWRILHKGAFAPQFMLLHVVTSITETDTTHKCIIYHVEYNDRPKIGISSVAVLSVVGSESEWYQIYLR